MDRLDAISGPVGASLSTAAEIAVVMNISDRTVRRDRQAIRRANTLRPGKDLADEVVGELCSRAESAISRLHRAVRDTGDGSVTLAALFPPLIGSGARRRSSLSSNPARHP